MNSFLRLRFILAAGFITLTAIVLQAQVEVILPHKQLSLFPARLGNWNGKDIALDKDTLEVLGPGDFMVRRYFDPASNLPSVDLFLAYFPSQRTADTIHSPKNCLPGAGWAPEENVRITLAPPRSFSREPIRNFPSRLAQDRVV